MLITPIHREIIGHVQAIRPALRVTSTFRPNAGYHSTGHAVDFTADRVRDLLEVFIHMTSKEHLWPGGLSLGIPPAQIHLHVDARHLAPTKGYRCHFIETALWDGKGCGEVFSPSSHALTAELQAKWIKTWKQTRSIYK